MAEIKVYHHDLFLCNAICQDIAEMVVSIKEIKAARSASKKELSGQIKQSQLLLKKIFKPNKAENISPKPDEPQSIDGEEFIKKRPFYYKFRLDVEKIQKIVVLLA